MIYEKQCPYCKKYIQTKPDKYTRCLMFSCIQPDHYYCYQENEVEEILDEYLQVGSKYEIVLADDGVNYYIKNIGNHKKVEITKADYDIGIVIDKVKMLAMLS